MVSGGALVHLPLVEWSLVIGSLVIGHWSFGLLVIGSLVIDIRWCVTNCNAKRTSIARIIRWYIKLLPYQRCIFRLHLYVPCIAYMVKKCGDCRKLFRNRIKVMKFTCCSRQVNPMFTLSLPIGYPLLTYSLPIVYLLLT